MAGAEGPLSPQEAQASLPRIPLQIGAHALDAEVADDPLERQMGLMFREELGADAAMLFIYPDERERSFWMKNTPLPLSIAYLDATGLIVHIADMQPLDVTPVPSRHAVRFALEVNQGWFEQHGVTTGQRLDGLPIAE